jgi:hypothetical protein
LRHHRRRCAAWDARQAQDFLNHHSTIAELVRGIQFYQKVLKAVNGFEQAQAGYCADHLGSTLSPVCWVLVESA